MALTPEQLKAILAGESATSTSKINATVISANGNKLMTLREGDKGTIFMNPTREGWLVLRMKNANGEVDTTENLALLLSKVGSVEQTTEAEEMTAEDIENI